MSPFHVRTNSSATFLNGCTQSNGPLHVRLRVPAHTLYRSRHCQHIPHSLNVIPMYNLFAIGNTPHNMNQRYPVPRFYILSATAAWPLTIRPGSAMPGARFLVLETTHRCAVALTPSAFTSSSTRSMLNRRTSGAGETPGTIGSWNSRNPTLPRQTR